MIAIACDHGGYDLKLEIIRYLKDENIEYIDLGCEGRDAVDYPVYARKVTDAIKSGTCEKGILICGTGVGISLAANKIRGIRAVVCSEASTARLSRQHNDTNILAFGARIIGTETAKDIVKAWLEAEFEGGRHQKRVDMLMKLEEE